ncbi:MAG: DUF4424 family protein [Alphaproteobacteria bacterium]
MQANDSSSELAAGGITLIKNETISIQREDLFLSQSIIRVRYEMQNDTGEPITLRVAFPMPEVPHWTPAGLDSSSGGHNILISPWKGLNFINFRVSVDGKEVKPDVDVRALLPNGTDVTATLRDIGGDELLLRPGLFDKDYAPQSNSEPSALSAAAIDRLKKIGALVEEGGGEMYNLKWNTTVTFHWMQTFQAGITKVEHTYRPIIGSQFIWNDASNRIRGSGNFDAEGNSTTESVYCIDDVTRNAILKLKKHQALDDQLLSGHSLAYIVQTARNWKGPIKNFHLTIQGGYGEARDTVSKNVGRVEADQGDATDGTVEKLGAGMNSEGTKKQIISLCTALPIKKTAALRFEATVSDYVPKEDLRILFIE